MTSWITRVAVPALAAGLFVGGMAPAAWAQDAAGVEQLTGTLKKINASKTITLGRDPCLRKA